MRRRLRKKLHREWLTDLVDEVSQGDGWRRRLFEAPASQRLRVDRDHLDGEWFSDEFPRAVIRSDLRFVVWRGDPEPQPDECTVPFFFEALEFPSVRGLSWNNPGYPDPADSLASREAAGTEAT